MAFQGNDKNLRKQNFMAAIQQAKTANKLPVKSAKPTKPALPVKPGKGKPYVTAGK